MPPKHLIVKRLIFPLLFLAVFALPMAASAKTVYVDQDGDNSNSGTSDEPFKTLEKAAEEVNKGDADEVRVKKGSFEGGVTFERGVTLEGAGKGSTTITGTLTFKKKAELKNLSVKTKSHTAVTLGKNAAGNFKDVDIRDFTGVGIWLTSGDSSLTLEDSRVGGSNGKGIYAEAGSKLNVSGSQIVNNKQEGIDIRQNTRGTIKNNTIEGNSESGIELIVGSSDFTVTGNKLQKNGASGIAYQFYSLNKKFGEIVTTNNTISGNRNYGLDCKKPQGGDSPAGYWADSISLEGNTFANNKNGEISTACKLIEAKTEEEEKALEQKLQEEEKAKAEAAAKLLQEAGMTDEERVNQELARTNELVQKTETIIQENLYNDLLGKITAKNSLKTFFFGVAGPETESLRQQIAQDETALHAYQEQVAVLPPYQASPELQGRIAAQEERLEQYRKQAEIFEQEKGILHSFQKDLLGRINRIIYVFPL